MATPELLLSHTLHEQTDLESASIPRKTATSSTLLECGKKSLISIKYGLRTRTTLVMTTFVLGTMSAGTRVRSGGDLAYNQEKKWQ